MHPPAAPLSRRHVTLRAAGVLATLLLVGAPASAAARGPGRVLVTVRSGRSGPRLPSGFVGLSTEYGAVMDYAGTDPSAINPVFVHLLANLNPGQRLALRIGGDSTDRTWWPVSGMARPAGVDYTLSPRWLAVTHALAQATRARVTLGINLEADSTPLAATEARTLLAGVGAGNVRALEIGNEPEYYSTRWYQTPSGAPVPGRPVGYGPAQYNADFRRFARVLPPVALAGPATGSPLWTSDLPALRSQESRLAVATVHRYPLNRCVTDRANRAYPTLANLLAPRSSRGLTSNLAGEAALARAHGLALRVDELNAVTCHGKTGVSDTFAAALWLLDTLFAAARSGIDGVNIHVWPGAVANELFTFRHHARGWSGTVHPSYYGALFFTQAAPPRATLLATGSSGAAGTLRVWATRGPDHRTHVVIINLSARRPDSVVVRLPARALAPAVVAALRAPDLAARSGVTLGGRSFGSVTSTGRLRGPVTITVRPRHGVYALRVAAASATMLTIPG